MLAVLKKPHIELSIQGENTEELIDWISKKYEVKVLTPGKSDSIPIEATDFWKEMIGNLLAGARLKSGLTQAQLARKLNISQNMVSDYERGKRRLSQSMAKRMANVLNIKIERLS